MDSANASNANSAPPTITIGPTIVNSSEVTMQAAINGAGVTRTLSYMVASEVKVGRLKIILSEFEPEPIPIHVIHREGRHAAARVRAFVDFVVARLRGNALLKS